MINSSAIFMQQQRSRLLLIVVLVVAVLVAGGWFVLRQIRQEVQVLIGNSMKAIVETAAEVYIRYSDSSRDFVGQLCKRPLVREYARAALAGDEDAQNWFAESVLSVGKSIDFVSFFLFDRSGNLRLASTGPSSGRLPALEPYLQVCLGGEPTITPPVLMPHDAAGGEPAPHIAACAPLADADGSVFGVLVMLIHPADSLGAILKDLRMGETGETYLVDRNGLMASPSRFTDDLHAAGLLATSLPTTVLAFDLRDPGGDIATMTAADLPPRINQPFIKSAAEVMVGRDGASLEPYPDYRGQGVVGAWRWLPDHQVGVITEVDVVEAGRPLLVLRAIFVALMTVLAVATAGLVVYLQRNAILARRAAKAEQQVQALGQYRLLRKLGAGGMGEVYVGEHAMMRRPTAIKLLPQTDNQENMARFEREVRLCCQLSHPNTIAIYDYGRTADNIFYYAMELLDGMDLDELVKAHGALPVPRVLHILVQACGSLAEAHDAGLIHRDIKPANIFLTRRGGICDVVKVLDFGLVKETSANSAQVTQENIITGTPAYISPEAAGQKDVDHRSDLYALGCVAYFLITGHAIFERDSVMGMLMAHLKETPEPMASHGVTVPADVEAAVFACLVKTPDERPASAAAWARQLRSCADFGRWSDEDASAWWASTGVERASGATEVMAVTKTLDLRLDMGG